MKVIHFEISVNSFKIGHFHLIQSLSDCSIVNNNTSDLDTSLYYDVNTTMNLNSKQGEEMILTLTDVVESCDTIICKCTNNSDSNVLLLTDQTACDCKCLANKNLVGSETIDISGVSLFAFYVTLINSPTYREYVLNNFLRLTRSSKICQRIKVVTINVSSIHDVNVIDYKWNARLQYLCLERKEFDKTMTWLSVIGGACSALGDVKIHFADRAGLISAEQFRLALKFADESAMARCKLFYAQSLIQKGNLEFARKIIKEQYRYGKQKNDSKFMSMCLGINAKWLYASKRQKNISGKT